MCLRGITINTLAFTMVAVAHCRNCLILDRAAFVVSFVAARNRDGRTDTRTVERTDVDRVDVDLDVDLVNVDLDVDLVDVDLDVVPFC